MRKISICTDGHNQVIRLPKDLEFEGVSELEVRRKGSALLLTPVRPDWLSMANHAMAGDDFLIDRESIVSNEDPDC